MQRNLSFALGFFNHYGLAFRAGNRNLAFSPWYPKGLFAIGAFIVFIVF